MSKPAVRIAPHVRNWGAGQSRENSVACSRWRNQQLFYFSLEHGDRLGTVDDHALLDPIAITQTEDEGGRSFGTQLPTCFQVLLNRRRVAAVVKARPVFSDVKADCLCVLRQLFGLQILLIGKKAIMHFPVLALVSRTTCGFGCLRR